ncbi:MAG: hypothetical protein EZS28_053775, partial [Streblomastix strix]
MLALAGSYFNLNLNANINDSTGQGLISFSGNQLTITGGFYSGPSFSSTNYLFTFSNILVTINSGTFIASKILNINQYILNIFEGTFTGSSQGAIGISNSYPTFIDLELIQFNGGMTNIDYGYFTGIQRESVYGQIKTIDSSEVTIIEDNENRTFLYIDFNAVGGHLIFEVGLLSRSQNRKFFILASESGIITIKNTISGPKFTNIDQIICNDKNTLNIFTGFSYSPENTSQALIQTFDSTVVIGIASPIDE